MQNLVSKLALFQVTLVEVTDSGLVMDQVYCRQAECAKIASDYWSAEMTELTEGAGLKFQSHFTVLEGLKVAIVKSLELAPESGST